MNQTAAEKIRTFAPMMKVYLEIRIREKQSELLTIDEIAKIFASLFNRREVTYLVDQLVMRDMCARSYGDGKPTITTSQDTRHSYLGDLEDWKVVRKTMLNITDA